MTTYTYSKARQLFSKVLDIARNEGKVLIKRRDGTLFSIQVEEQNTSPLDVPGINTTITTKEIIETVRKSRSRA